jgi:hypothetical protein
VIRGRAKGEPRYDDLEQKLFAHVDFGGPSAS